jgi:hypothetical protein
MDKMRKLRRHRQVINILLGLTTVSIVIFIHMSYIGIERLEEPDIFGKYIPVDTFIRQTLNKDWTYTYDTIIIKQKANGN